MRLGVCAAMADGVVDSHCRNMVDALEVIHTVAVSDVAFTAEDIDDGGVDLVELILAV